MVTDNFVYDSEGNLIEDKSKNLKISYDWRGMPVEFRMESTRVCSIGNMDAGGVNMPQGLGRYGADDAVNSRGNGRSFEWYLKNHLGSTMLVYGTQWVDDENLADVGAPLAAYDYRATVVAMRTKQQVAKCCPPFGEQITLSEPTEKVTENFTGKEKDDETELNYFGARYLDPMIGLWISVDPKRQFASPYLYAGNGVNPVNGFDPDGNVLMMQQGVSNEYRQGVADAIAYLNARGAAGEIASLHFKSML